MQDSQQNQNSYRIPQIPRIPQILFNDKLIIGCAEKATLYDEYVLAHCRSNVTNSNLPHLSYHTETTADLM